MLSANMQGPQHVYRGVRMFSSTCYQASIMTVIDPERSALAPTLFHWSSVC